MQFVIHLDDATVAALVDTVTAERAVADAFAAWGRGEAATTQRMRAAVPAAGMVSAMAAVVPPYCGGKLYATNAGRFTFLNVLFDVDGTLLATVDGDVVTSLRTPAASALAIRHLAPRQSSVATLIGTGHQARPHLEMLLRTLPDLSELRVCGRNDIAVSELVDRAAATAVTITRHRDPHEAVVGAHVIVTVTSSYDPLFPAAAISDEALICAVGATKADRAEIEPSLVARCAAVVCDDVAGSRVECGDLVRAAAVGHFDWTAAIELNAVAAGAVSVPRPSGAPVLFETQGVAVQDVAVSALAYERFVQRSEIAGLGGARRTQEVS